MVSVMDMKYLVNYKRKMLIMMNIVLWRRGLLLGCYFAGLATDNKELDIDSRHNIEREGIR